MKYKIGQKVRIVEDFSCHGFEIGEVVKIVEFCGLEPFSHYRVSNGNDSRYVVDEEIEPIKEEKVKLKKDMVIGKKWEPKKGDRIWTIEVNSFGEVRQSCFDFSGEGRLVIFDFPTRDLCREAKKLLTDTLKKFREEKGL